ncbi:MAG: hypothetical protein WCJ74_02785 [bacterium]
MKNKNLYTFLAINKISKVLIILICCAFFSQLSNAANNNLKIAGSLPANPNPNDTVYPLQLSLTAYEYGNTFNVSCFGFKDGSIDLSVSGGTPPYTYQWSEGDSVEDITNLPAGYYKVTVTDADSSIAEVDITLTQPTPLNKLKTEFTTSKYPNSYNVSCINCYNGSINVSVYGGSGAYVYSWADDSLAGLNRTGLGAGNYVIDVRDTNICSGGDEVKENIVLKEPPSEGWSMEGNANINANQFIGTTDESHLNFMTNNEMQMELLPTTITTPKKIKITGDASVSDNFAIGKNLLVAGSFQMDSLVGDGFVFDSLSTKRYKMVFADEEGNLVAPGNRSNENDYVCGIPTAAWNLGGNFIDTRNHHADFIGTCNNWPFCIKTKGVERMRITPNGNVGLGTENPKTALDLLGHFYIHDNSGSAVIYFPENGNFYFRSSNTPLVYETSSEKMFIGGNGNVGIGTISPLYKLDVCGTIRSNEWIVETAWWDCKFATGYKRMTWQEKLEFIKAYKHLPEIESADDININGLKVAKTMKGFVYNIEDNTLDIIELYKENQKNKEEIEKLVKENYLLQKKLEELALKIQNIGKE